RTGLDPRGDRSRHRGAATAFHGTRCRKGERGSRPRGIDMARDAAGADAGGNPRRNQSRPTGPVARRAGVRPRQLLFTARPLSGGGRRAHWTHDGVDASQEDLGAVDHWLRYHAHRQTDLRADGRDARRLELEACPAIPWRKRVGGNNPPVIDDGAHIRCSGPSCYFGAGDDSLTAVAAGARGAAFLTYLSSQLMYSHSRCRWVSTAV